MDDMIPHFVCRAVIVAEDVAINRLRMNTIDNIYLNQDLKKLKEQWIIIYLKENLLFCLILLMK